VRLEVPTVPISPAVLDGFSEVLPGALARAPLNTKRPGNAWIARLRTLKTSVQNSALLASPRHFTSVFLTAENQDYGSRVLGFCFAPHSPGTLLGEVRTPADHTNGQWCREACPGRDLLQPQGFRSPQTCDRGCSCLQGVGPKRADHVLMTRPVCQTEKSVHFANGLVSSVAVQGQAMI
jgi:hypothetical protein